MSRFETHAERRSWNEHGVATVLASVLVLGLIVTLWFGMQLGVATIVRHRAEGAADLAALAAAAHVPQGRSSACAQARRVVRGMSGAVVACRIDGVESRVRVRMPLPAIGTTLSAVDGVRGRARAGPAGSRLPITAPATARHAPEVRRCCPLADARRHGMTGRRYGGVPETGM